MTRYEPMGTSSAVASVLHSGGMKNNIEVTKAGSYIYRGDASNFHEWKFRTRLRLKAAGGDDNRYAEQMSKVVDGLQGDAFTTARELGLEKLWQSGRAETEDEEAVEPGVDILIKAIKAVVFPLTTYEAKELFRQYCKPVGILARQNGESMQQYIGRRSRCWKLLKELDPEISLSEGHRADMLLDLAGLDKNERIMIQASIGNERDFAKISEALIKQHPRIHLTKPGSRAPGPRPQKGRGKGKGKKGRFRSFVNHKTRNPSNFAGVLFDDYYEDDYECAAYIGAEEEDVYNGDPAYWYEEDEEGEDQHAYPYWEEEDVAADAFSAYVAEEWSKKIGEAVESAIEAAELDCIALLSSNHAECLEDPDIAADFIQSGAVAFLTGRKGKGKANISCDPPTFL